MTILAFIGGVIVGIVGLMVIIGFTLARHW